MIEAGLDVSHVHISHHPTAILSKNMKSKMLFLMAVALFSTDYSFADTPSTSTSMPKQRVTGIGGFFFRSNDPVALARWYLERLGVDPIPSDYGQKAWTQEAGSTAFAPFPKDTVFAKDKDQSWMIDFRVSDLDAMVAQLRASGEHVKVDPKVYPNGRFARLRDPEGNPIELWEPKKGS